MRAGVGRRRGSGEKLSQSDFDLLVTDLCMPRKHGHALALEILNRPSAPIIVVHSSVENPKLIKDLMIRGVDDVISKPTDYRLFAVKVKGLTIRRRFQRTQEHEEQRELLRVSRAAIDVLLMATLDQTTIDSVSTNIQNDPVLASELLRLANSCLQNPGQREITSLKEAVCRIGRDRVCEFITDELQHCSEDK